MVMKVVLAGFAAALATSGFAQAQVGQAPADEHAGHSHGSPAAPPPKAPVAPAQVEQKHDMQDMGKQHQHAIEMKGMYGSYPMTREASGTAWQPDSSPHAGVITMLD